MLKQNQIDYLKKIYPKRIAHVLDFDPKTQTTAHEIISKIQSVFPLVTIYYIGSSALGIAGENDLDITIVAKNNFDECLEMFTKFYGIPKYENFETKNVKWEFDLNSFLVELYLSAFLSSDLQEQLNTHNILENNKNLRLEYEGIKRESNGLPWKEYLTRKYEFWNRILEIG